MSNEYDTSKPTQASTSIYFDKAPQIYQPHFRVGTHQNNTCECECFIRVLSTNQGFIAMHLMGTSYRDFDPPQMNVVIAVLCSHQAALRRRAELT